MHNLDYLIYEPCRIDCPYCEQPLDGPIQDGMHEECSKQFGRDLEEVYPDEAYLTSTPDFGLEEPEEEEDPTDAILAILERF